MVEKKIIYLILATFGIYLVFSQKGQAYLKGFTQSVTNAVIPPAIAGTTTGGKGSVTDPMSPNYDSSQDPTIKTGPQQSGGPDISGGMTAAGYSGSQINPALLKLNNSIIQGMRT